jgi:hypothetical protein
MKSRFNLSVALSRSLELPSFMKKVVIRAGLTERFVTSELRRAHKFLAGGRVTGRQTISYRVLRALIEVDQEFQDELQALLEPCSTVHDLQGLQ